MKIACEACGAKYTIADDKVRGRKVKIRCKGCGTPIVVDGQHGHGDGGSISDAETETALEAVEAPAVWSVNLSDTDSRTMSVEELVAGYASGLVTSDAFVWKDGMTDWVAVLDSELAPLLQNAPRAQAPDAQPVATATAAAVAGAKSPSSPFQAPNFGAPAPAGSRPAAARAAAARVPAQPDNTQDLFGGSHAAGSDEDEVATSAPVVPQAGASAYDDGKMTGARNENSVLFSLDALKAGFSPSAPAPNAKPLPKAPKSPSSRPQQPSNPDDPFGMGASAGLGGGTLFGADNQALLTAPAPLPPPTPAQVASGMAPSAYPPAWQSKPVLIVGGIGGVVIVGLLAALLFGKKHDATPSPDDSALAAASTAPSAGPAPEAKQGDQPAPKVENTPAASASVSPVASASPSASATGTKPVAVVASVKNDAAKKPKEDAPPPADAPPFSKASAISALSAAASAAGSCKKPGGPTGSGKTTVTFAPSGRATTATVAGSFAGTPVGGCVASVFRRAHVPAFSGSSVTVSKSFNIN
jgi:predicted Zn finger-like uncharacterized protein